MIPELTGLAIGGSLEGVTITHKGLVYYDYRYRYCALDGLDKPACGLWIHDSISDDGLRDYMAAHKDVLHKYFVPFLNEWRRQND